MVNVDLLIKDENKRTLLSWRDATSGSGWHVPGGIIRFKESFEYRINKVAELEIGSAVRFDPIPIAFNQVILEQITRGHFISFLYKCFLSSDFIPPNKGLSEREPGFLQWHNSCPDNLIKVHKMYIPYF
jgi:colanic acid biosynthesis protein WcaH